MVRVSTNIGERTYSAEISDDTYELLRDGAALRRKPPEWFLFLVVVYYGDLTEANILKFMDEKWVI